MRIELLQVYFLVQCRGEGGHNPRCIIFLAVEAAIYNTLHKMAEGLKQGHDNQCGDNQHRSIAATNEIQDQVLSSEDKQPIRSDQDSGQRAIDQSAIDKSINIPEPVAQQSNANADRHRKIVEAEER